MRMILSMSFKTLSMTVPSGFLIASRIEVLFSSAGPSQSKESIGGKRICRHFTSNPQLVSLMR